MKELMSTVFAWAKLERGVNVHPACGPLTTFYNYINTLGPKQSDSI